MENRIYKKPPINEMYMSVHFEAKPLIGTLDFHQFIHQVKSDFIKKDYIYPVIERIGNLERIPIEPEKIWFLNEAETKLLQFIKDRIVYNWRVNPKASEPIIYPKYESIKKDFFKYWNLLLQYIHSYKDRVLNVKIHELYYSNIIPIGENCFLKNSNELFKAFNIISSYPKNYINIDSQINLQLPIKDDLLFLNLRKTKTDINKEAIVFILLMKSKSQVSKSINEDWYNTAHTKINNFFEEITTEDMRNYWKKGGTQ